MIVLTAEQQVIQDLRIELWAHRYLYFELSTNIIPDWHYTQMEKEELAKLEQATPWRMEESPNSRVGYSPPEYLIPTIEELLAKWSRLGGKF